MDKRFASVHYAHYLQLDKILNAQHLRSGEVGEPAHDELLFIIVHQVYELWFKQIIHDLESIMEILRRPIVSEEALGRVVSRLRRIEVILDLMISQITLLETMTPLDFLEFRNYLLPASGFQSFQFRKIEVLLGLDPSQRITYQGKDYKESFTEEQQQELRRLEQSPSLWDCVERWLERTPFLEFADFRFLQAYKEAAKRMIEEEREAILQASAIDEEQKQIRLQMLEQMEQYFSLVLSEEGHRRMVEQGRWRLSYKATLAALFIHLYRDEPMLQMPYRLLASLVEIDERLTLWRYRHAQMVRRMIGKKIGTGGSSGYDYLIQTVERHTIFLDFANLTTLMIPRSALPPLPPALKKALNYHFYAIKDGGVSA